MTSPKKIGLVVSGASGSLLALQAVRLLVRLKTEGLPIEIHLLITEGGQRTAQFELTQAALTELTGCADHLHDDSNLAASIASGSNPLDALLFVPCSIRSLCAIAYGQTDRLSIRAADVMLKERKKLVLAVRESPFHAGHLQAMLQITQMGGIIAPPLPAFYLQPKSIEDMAEQSAARLLSLLELDDKLLMQRWQPEAR